MHVVCPECGAVNRVPPERMAEHPHCGKCGGTSAAKETAGRTDRARASSRRLPSVWARPMDRMATRSQGVDSSSHKPVDRWIKPAASTSQPDPPKAASSKGMKAWPRDSLSSSIARVPASIRGVKISSRFSLWKAS